MRGTESIGDQKKNRTTTHLIDSFARDSFGTANLLVFGFVNSAIDQHVGLMCRIHKELNFDQKKLKKYRQGGLETNDHKKPTHLFFAGAYETSFPSTREEAI